jgi:2'-hydroxyisoflavone reductase
MDVSHERALAAGLALTDPAVTARDTRAWLQGKEGTPALSPEREAELIRAARRAPRAAAPCTPGSP